MRRLVSLAVFLAVFSFVPLAAQDDGPNVTVAAYFKTLPGKADAYNAYVREFFVPLNDESVRRGQLVSVQILVQAAGAGEFTNIYLMEYANWDAANDDTPEEMDAACQTLFGMTYAEKRAELDLKYGEVSTLRTLIRTEHYTSLKP